MNTSTHQIRKRKRKLQKQRKKRLKKKKKPRKRIRNNSSLKSESQIIILKTLDSLQFQRFAFEPLYCDSTEVFLMYLNLNIQMIINIKK